MAFMVSESNLEMQKFVPSLYLPFISIPQAMPHGNPRKAYPEMNLSTHICWLWLVDL